MATDTVIELKTSDMKIVHCIHAAAGDLGLVPIDREAAKDHTAVFGRKLVVMRIGSATFEHEGDEDQFTEIFVMDPHTAFEFAAELLASALKARAGGALSTEEFLTKVDTSMQDKTTTSD